MLEAAELTPKYYWQVAFACPTDNFIARTIVHVTTYFFHFFFFSLNILLFLFRLSVAMLPIQDLTFSMKNFTSAASRSAILMKQEVKVYLGTCKKIGAYRYQWIISLLAFLPPCLDLLCQAWSLMCNSSKTWLAVISPSKTGYRCLRLAAPEHHPGTECLLENDCSASHPEAAFLVWRL